MKGEKWGWPRTDVEVPKYFRPLLIPLLMRDGRTLDMDCKVVWQNVKEKEFDQAGQRAGGAQVVREGPTRLFGILAPKIRTCGWLWVPPKVGYTSSSTDSTASERLYCWWQKKYFIINTQNDELSRSNAKCQIFTVFKLYSFTISIFVLVSV